MLHCVFFFFCSADPVNVRSAINSYRAKCSVRKKSVKHDVGISELENQGLLVTLILFTNTHRGIQNFPAVLITLLFLYKTNTQDITCEFMTFR